MYYFVSDIHLGSGTPQEARATEQRFVKWLRRVGEDAEAIFLCGDIFDFWFEYQHVVPKGFVRTLAQIASLTDRGVRVVFMAGNHDMWLGNYLSAECGVEIYTRPKIFTLSGKRVHVAHGDNLNVQRDLKLKIMNNTFRSSTVRKLFSTLVHPDLALRFGLWWSDKSREKHIRGEGHNTIDGLYVRSLVEYAEQQQLSEPCDLYIYGHLHQTLRHSCDGFEVLFINDWSEDPHYITLNEEGEAKIEKA
ncbi:MAG: UDP-2,3-diacylglucosamine diphosphatase [Rikenellaceae bacterium]